MEGQCYVLCSHVASYLESTFIHIAQESTQPWLKIRQHFETADSDFISLEIAVLEGLSLQRGLFQTAAAM